MTSDSSKPAKASNESPGSWDRGQLRGAWSAHLESVRSKGLLDLPLARLRHQAERDPSFHRIVEAWPSLAKSARTEAWRTLTALAERKASQVLPQCVRCGVCCQKGSPTLHPDDLPLVREQRLPWSQLLTLRVGERARSPFTGELFTLAEEQIKLQEKPSGCVFFDADEPAPACTIHPHRPIQCRAQACWDPGPARALGRQPHLSRSRLFGEIPALLEIIEEHERRCPFARLREACEALAQSHANQLDGLLEIVAFEDHFRCSMAAELGIPADTLDFLFGRSFVDLLPLFGLEVETSTDGTRTLVPLNASGADS